MLPFFIFHVLILIWIIYVFLSGTLVFGTGFLLSRIEINNRSSCFLQENTSNCHSVSGPRGRFSRCILLLIDGLRYDFVDYDITSNSTSHIYRNKMPIFKELQFSEPQNRALLVPFIADPPTTTLQRLKGLTTGSLPTFVDIGANFGSDEISEDNIISQSATHGKRTVFMGDDTWMGLFPRQFNISFPYPSFNVKDLHTVDNGIMQNLPQVMKQKNWDIIIAHFLGVDHCGHRYGPDHPEMTKKLQQMNDIIRDVVNMMDNQTVLFVMGDHGMTKTGDHGGSSSEEVTSALFIYSKSRLMFFPREEDPVSQVDFVPTFAMLLGLPIPFSNLGCVISELFEECENVLRENVKQVATYIDAYSRVSSSFPAALLQELNEVLLLSEDMLRSKELHSIPQTCKVYKDYLTRVKKMCLSQWAQFDIPTMVLGIAILTVGILYLALLLLADRESDAQLLTQHIGSGLLFGMCMSCWTCLLPQFLWIHVAGLFCFFSVLFPLVCLLKLMCSVFSQTKEQLHPKKDAASSLTFRERIESKFSLKELCNCFPSIVMFLYFVSFFSNSFVVNENYVLLVLSQSVVIVSAFPVCYVYFLKKGGPRWKFGSVIMSTAMLLLLIRLGSLFFMCREEQEFCSPFLFSEFHVSDKCHLFLASLFLFAIVLVLSLCLKYFSNSFDVAHLFVKYALFAGFLFIVAHWSITKAPEKMLKKLLPGNEEIAAKIAYLCCLSVFGIIVVKPILSTTSSVLNQFSSTLCLNLASILAAMSLILCLLSGEKLAVGITLILLSMVLWTYLACNQNTGEVHDFGLGWNCTVVWALLSSYGFFVTGHQAAFSSIHWNAAFVTSDGNSTGKFRPALDVTLETFSSQVLFTLALPLLPVVFMLLAQHQLHMPRRIFDVASYRPLLLVWKNCKASVFEKCLMRLNVSLLLFSGIKLLATVLACTFLRDHLMVWKIFAPRFVFESASAFVTMVTTVIAYLLTLRIIYSLPCYAIKN